MPTNFELERLKPKLDIFKIPENRVHELTDSNVSLFGRRRGQKVIRVSCRLASCAAELLFIRDACAAWTVKLNVFPNIIDHSPLRLGQANILSNIL